MIIWEDGQKSCAALNNRILLTGATHFWVSIVLESIGQASFSDTLSRFPFLGRLYMRFNPEWLRKLIEGSARHEKYTLDLIHKLVFALWKKKEENTSLTEPKKNQAENRPKRLYKLSLKSRTREHRGGNCNHSTGSPRIRLRVRLFIFWFTLAFADADASIAGSETTATALAVATYYLCHEKEILKKLQKEIRTTFQAQDEINSSTTANLRYLHAVCLEALRLFPPLPLGLPRVVPAGGDTIDGYFVPEGVSCLSHPRIFSQIKKYSHISPRQSWQPTFAANLAHTNFHDPWRFDPDRWVGLNESDQLEASQPFSMGSRACLGRG